MKTAVKLFRKLCKSRDGSGAHLGQSLAGIRTDDTQGLFADRAYVNDLGESVMLPYQVMLQRPANVKIE